MPTWPSPRSDRLGTPNSPAIRFARGSYFGASWFTHLLRPVRLLAPLYGSDWNAQPPGAFTSRLSTGQSPSPLLDITTTATGLLCWRDSHPLEWQLASLHGQSRQIADVRDASAVPPILTVIADILGRQPRASKRLPRCNIRHHYSITSSAMASSVGGTVRP